MIVGCKKRISCFEFFNSFFENIIIYVRKQFLSYTMTAISMAAAAARRAVSAAGRAVAAAGRAVAAAGRAVVAAGRAVEGQ